jgi:hypothetical protein
MDSALVNIREVGIENTKLKIEEFQSSLTDHTARSDVLSQRISAAESTLLESRISMSRELNKIVKVSDDLSVLSSNVVSVKKTINDFKSELVSIQDATQSARLMIDDLRVESSERHDKLEDEIATKMDILSKLQQESLNSAVEKLNSFATHPDRLRMVDALIRSTKILVANISSDRLDRKVLGECVLTWSMVLRVSRIRRLSACSIFRIIKGVARRFLGLWTFRVRIMGFDSLITDHLREIRETLAAKCERKDVHEIVRALEGTLESRIESYNTTMLSSIADQIRNNESIREDQDNTRSIILDLKSKVDILESKLSNSVKTIESVSHNYSLIPDRLDRLEKDYIHLNSELKDLKIAVSTEDSPQPVHVEKQADDVSQKLFTDMLLLWSFVRDVQARLQQHDSHIATITTSQDRVDHDLKILTERFDSNRMAESIDKLRLTQSRVTPRPVSANMTRASSGLSAQQDAPLKSPIFDGLHTRGRAIAAQKPKTR